MEKKVKYKTKQQEYIVEYLKENSDKHITAEEIIKHFKLINSPIGKSTVYRCLDRLLEENVVRKYVISEREGSCYQYIGEEKSCNNHYHMKCTKCGKLYHLECDEVKELQEHILKHHNFKIDICKTVLYGLCSNCM